VELLDPFSFLARSIQQVKVRVTREGSPSHSNPATPAGYFENAFDDYCGSRRGYRHQCPVCRGLWVHQPARDTSRGRHSPEHSRFEIGAFEYYAGPDVGSEAGSDGCNDRPDDPAADNALTQPDDTRTEADASAAQF
jgi:hypothetical protein